MGFFKRKVNPIFVEDEQYQWGGKRRGLRVLLLTLFSVVIIGLIVVFATLPI